MGRSLPFGIASGDIKEQSEASCGKENEQCVVSDVLSNFENRDGL